MSKELSICNAITLPNDAVTQTFGCIGRKGAGKTYLAGKLAEEMLDIHAQVVVIDPVGNWWGLRVAADGKAKGKDIFVIGGEHGDIPITVAAGANIARFLVEKGVSAVLDISGFRQGERKRFAADFAEEFFHLKKTQRSAVHLMVEEAQLFVPQRCGPDEARMLGAFESIIRLGRNYGIGATLISQRPQSVNKEVLSQVECLCVLQVNGAHERKALEEWVQEAGADRKLVGELPGLARGEGYVWSPSWLRVFQKVKFGKKVTFDASATPEVGRTMKAAMLSAVDVQQLRADLETVVADAEKDDPKVLRRRIAELEREAKKPIEDDARLRNMEQANDALNKEVMRIAKERNIIIEALRELLKAAEGRAQAPTDIINRHAEKGVARHPAAFLAPEVRRSIANNPPIKRTAGDELRLPKAERTILTVLKNLGASSKYKIAAYAGYAPNGGGFNNALSALRSSGYIDGRDTLNITTEGSVALGFWEPLPSGRELLEYWQGKLPKAERLIVTVLYGCGKLTKHELAEACEYAPNGGGFNNALSHLRTMELIDGRDHLDLTKDFRDALGR